MAFTRNMSAYDLLLSGLNSAAVVGNSVTIRKDERIRILYIILLLLISGDTVIVVCAVGNDGSKNNQERKMIGSEILDRVRIILNENYY